MCPHPTRHRQARNQELSGLCASSATGAWPEGKGGRVSVPGAHDLRKAQFETSKGK